MHTLFKIIITALSLLLVAYFVPGIAVSSFFVALLVALVLGLLNIFIKPLLVILTLPINIITLGLFTFIINGFLFWLTAQFISGFMVSGFWVAVIGALVVSVFSWLGMRLLD